MRIRFFGRPWPHPDRRASVCEDDRFEVPIHLVVGKRCLACKKRIVEDDRGVITGCSPNIKGHFRLLLAQTEEDIEPDELPSAATDYAVCAYHLTCFIRETLGEDMAKAVALRMHLNPGDEELSVEEIDALEKTHFSGWENQ